MVFDQDFKIDSTIPGFMAARDSRSFFNCKSFRIDVEGLYAEILANLIEDSSGGYIRGCRRHL
jgi:hypothetical protein